MCCIAAISKPNSSSVLSKVDAWFEDGDKEDKDVYGDENENKPKSKYIYTTSAGGGGCVGTTFAGLRMRMRMKG